MEKHTECCICTESCDDGGGYTLECGHRFHVPCVVRWFRQSPSCPMCRSIDATHFPNTTIHARATILRQHARHNTAPRELKILALRMSDAENNLKEVKRWMTEFKKQHSPMLQEYQRLVRARTYRESKMRRARRNLGVYSGVQIPLLFEL